ncbi:hypothetical protein EVAR_91720_1 [Eumeta japonica]|uniref:Uncharacterized protein n=1 Tax=Eumeta variegata TaxID=151549 RepID=A0A4C1SYA8_EUMVA|nr:hypothetical protein EVAR_91720_1 [Eumeta japonica]
MTSPSAPLIHDTRVEAEWGSNSDRCLTPAIIKDCYDELYWKATLLSAVSGEFPLAEYRLAGKPTSDVLFVCD